MAKNPEARFAAAGVVRKLLESHGWPPGQAHAVFAAPSREQPAIRPLTPDVIPTPPGNPQELLARARTIRIQQNSGNPELVTSVESELLKWKRYALVAGAEPADLLLELTPTAERDPLWGTGARAAATLTSQQGTRLWSTVRGGEWSTGGSLRSVGRAIVKELRKFAGS